MALGILGQKMKGTHHIQAEDERALPLHPRVPHELRIDLERESRRMAGYLYGKQISEKFLELFETEPKHVKRAVQSYLEQQDDPRLAEIMTRLLDVYQNHMGES
jgi:hypothetical protein